jgi:uncharacterized protein (DUF2267 family)
MKHDQLISNARKRADLQSNDEAERAIRATFETLRERLARNEPNNLTNQLPPEIADTLRGEGGRDNFSLEEFYQHVGEKEGVDQDVASRHARAVASVLQEAVTTGEMDDVRGQLKPEYAELSGRYGE